MDSGLSLSDLQKAKSSEKNIFERITSLSLSPSAAAKNVLTKYQFQQPFG